MNRMNINRFEPSRSLSIIGLLAIALVASTTISARTSGTTSSSPTFQGLGQMQGVVIQAGQCGTQALGISGDGSSIVGFGCVPSSTRGNADQAFRWTVSGGYQRLGDLGGGSSDALAASLDGSAVVGESTDSTGTNQGFRWTAAQGMVQIPVIGNAVTDDGTLVADGNWWKTSGQTGSYGSITQCGTPQTGFGIEDISSDGSVGAGFGKGGLDLFGQQATNAYRGTPDGKCADIDTVFNRNSDASGISADGTTIVGELQLSGGEYHAFRWTAASGMVDIGTLGSGNLVSRALATSHDGSVVVGHSLTTTSTSSDHAFVWTAKCGMLDLNTVLRSVIPKGWYLQIATDISEDGTVITGWGVSPPVPGSNFGQTEPWRAVLPVVCK